MPRTIRAVNKSKKPRRPIQPKISTYRCSHCQNMVPDTPKNNHWFTPLYDPNTAEKICQMCWVAICLASLFGSDAKP